MDRAESEKTPPPSFHRDTTAYSEKESVVKRSGQFAIRAADEWKMGDKIMFFEADGLRVRQIPYGERGGDNLPGGGRLYSAATRSEMTQGTAYLRMSVPVFSFSRKAFDF